MTNAMEEAFARVGIHGYGSRQAGRTLVPRPKPEPPPGTLPPENRGIATTKERMAIAIAEIGAMSDGELEIEMIALTENMEAIRVELRAIIDEPGLHEVGWRRRAERAAAGLKARLALCQREDRRRQQVVTEGQASVRATRKAERMAEHERFLAEHQAKKEARIADHEAKGAVDALSFVNHARALLPRETYLAIWAAVNAR
jgi:hypothetical protein